MPVITDPSTIINHQFGRLTAIRPDARNKYEQRENFWLFHCSCGGTKRARLSAAKCGNVKSCGCLKHQGSTASAHPELKGQQINQLTVLSWAGMRRLKSQRCSSWLCRCSCGTEKVILEANILTGASQSCGCLNSISSSIHGATNTPFYAWLQQQQSFYRKHNYTWPFKTMAEAVYALRPIYEARPHGIKYRHSTLLAPEDPTDPTNLTYKIFHSSKERKGHLGIKGKQFLFEVDGICLNLGDWGRVLGVTRQRAHQLFQADHLATRIRKALKSSLCPDETEDTPNPPSEARNALSRD